MVPKADRIWRRSSAEISQVFATLRQPSDLGRPMNDMLEPVCRRPKATVPVPRSGVRRPHTIRLSPYNIFHQIRAQLTGRRLFKNSHQARWLFREALSFAHKAAEFSLMLRAGCRRFRAFPAPACECPLPRKGTSNRTLCVGLSLNFYI
jgi:hypothetical protein